MGLISSNFVGYSLMILLLLLVVISVYFATSKKIDNERVTIITGYFKYLLGSIVLALMTFLIGKGLEERELAIKESEHLNAQAATFLGKDVGTKKEYVHFFSVVTRSEPARKRWVEYYDAIVSEYNEELKESESRDSLLKKNDSIIRAEKIKWSEQIVLIDSLQNELDKSNSKDEVLEQLAVSRKELNKTQEKFDSIQIENYDLNKKQRVAEYKLKSVAEKKIDISLSSDLSSKTCTEFLQPLITCLDSTKTIYEKYEKDKGYKYKYAKILYRLNNKMKDLLNAKILSIPTELINPGRELLEHFNAWTVGYLSLLEKVESPKDNDRFRVIYDGSRFPKDAANLFRNEWNNTCNQD